VRNLRFNINSVFECNIYREDDFMIKKVFKKGTSFISVIMLIVILLPIVLYVAIFITNNCIADGIEKNLVKYKLPSDTVLVDSVSVAGKLTGSGNGMQYMGAILVKSELSEEELHEHYSDEFNYIEISRQNAENIRNPSSDCYIFGYFSDMDVNSYYSITCWDSKVYEKFGGFIVKLLDFDLRGH